MQIAFAIKIHFKQISLAGEAGLHFKTKNWLIAYGTAIGSNKQAPVNFTSKNKPILKIEESVELRPKCSRANSPFVHNLDPNVAIRILHFHHFIIYFGLLLSVRQLIQTEWN